VRPWTCRGGLGQVVGTPVHSGAHALAAKASASDDAQCSETVTVQANHTYTLSAYVQGDYAFLGATTAAGDTSTWTPAATSFSKLSVAVSTGSSTSITIWVHGWYGQGTVYVDDVTLA